MDKDARTGIPRREQAAPGMLGPAGRGNIEVQIAGLQADPVHRRQMPHRVALVAVQDHFWFGGGAGGEVQQHRRIGLMKCPGQASGALISVLILDPPRLRKSDGDPAEITTYTIEFCAFRLTDQHMPDRAARNAILQVA